MIKRIIYPLIAILIGIFLLLFPEFLNYFNPNTLPFDFAKFLNDYPSFKIVLGILLIASGLAGFAFLFFIKKHKTIFVIQESGDGDYGSPDLHYSFLTKGESDEIVYSNLATLNNHSKDVIRLEMEHIKKFYERLPKQNKMAFLAVATIPSIVYGGYVFGESGRKVKYYHWNRDKHKAKRIIGFRQKCRLFTEQRINSPSKSKDYVLYISVSYPPNKEQAKIQFGDVNYIYCQTNKIGVDVVTTTKDLLDIAKQVREVISSIASNGTIVHLILQCPAEVCFAIGQKLNSPGLPKIKIYSYNTKNELKPWDWSIDIM